MAEYKYYGQPHGGHYLVLTPPFQWEEIAVDDKICLYVKLGSNDNVNQLIRKLSELVSND